MKHYWFHLISASKLVFSDRRYFFWFLMAAFVMFWLLIYIPVRTIPGNDLQFQLSILTPKDWFLFTVLPSLTALSLIMNIYILNNKKSLQDGVYMVGQGGTGFISGIIASVFGTATCASCVASIFGFLGFTSVLFLLQHRTLIATVAVILMLISLYFTSKRVLNVCDACRIGAH